MEYDFTVTYIKGEETGLADTLSRGKNDGEIKSKKYEKRAKTIEEKHKIKINGKDYWTFDSGKSLEIPNYSKRQGIIREAHDKQSTEVQNT